MSKMIVKTNITPIKLSRFYSLYRNTNILFIIILNNLQKMLKQTNLQFQSSNINLSTETSLIQKQSNQHSQIRGKNKQQLIKECKNTLRQYTASIIRRMFKYDTVQNQTLLKQLAQDIFPVRQYVAEYVIKHKRSRTLKQNISLLKVTADQSNLPSIALIYRLLEDEIKSQEEQLERYRRKKQKENLAQYQRNKENITSMISHKNPKHNHSSQNTEIEESKIPSPLLSFITSVIWNQASSISKLWKKQQKSQQTQIQFEQAFICDQQYVEGWWNKYVDINKGNNVNSGGLIKHD